ncbi:DNAJC7 isoform 5 [Pan troglodytes]|uniref:DnaJ heat shock protein family (Hsp40) member C7 n=3 Tax=Hominidae TaxID=9604 RepID=K7ENB7_HUMAN|nr:DNAJC7 isoform 5 [Pan troglodytes]PNJ07197.1 DNAJC7 isoform 5 [Pongo abelii]
MAAAAECDVVMAATEPELLDDQEAKSPTPLTSHPSVPLL